eukprot:GGOE01008693.1.p2 GENE.GGOE01008693.1~~GGOE01008693.1.p2  ORF type:complete len:123 (+),score=0.62 GGOE01008693.1:135-503(+)
MGQLMHKSVQMPSGEKCIPGCRCSSKKKMHEDEGQGTVRGPAAAFQMVQGNKYGCVTVCTQTRAVGDEVGGGVSLKMPQLFQPGMKPQHTHNTQPQAHSEESPSNTNSEEVCERENVQRIGL